MPPLAIEAPLKREYKSSYGFMLSKAIVRGAVDSEHEFGVKHKQWVEWARKEYAPHDGYEGTMEPWTKFQEYKGECLLHMALCKFLY